MLDVQICSYFFRHGLTPRVLQLLLTEEPVHILFFFFRFGAFVFHSIFFFGLPFLVPESSVTNGFLKRNHRQPFDELNPRGEICLQISQAFLQMDLSTSRQYIFTTFSGIELTSRISPCHLLQPISQHVHLVDFLRLDYHFQQSHPDSLH